MPPLFEIVQAVLSRFHADLLSVPTNTFVFGFITPDGEACSVALNRSGAQVHEGVQYAEYLLFGPRALFAALLDPDAPDRASHAGQLQMRPDYPFNNYLLSIFLNAFDLSIPELDYTARRFDGPFPFPPRYPAVNNGFRSGVVDPAPLPACDMSRLPALIAEGHPIWESMFAKAWQLAFGNLRQPEPESGFVASFIDPAFNANTYLWDSCFMMMFGRYARQQFPFMGTLDNFYAKQHDDGFICREINTYSGRDLFQSLDPRSTGPNIFAWTEWQDFQHIGDMHRLRAIFPVLIAYHRWWRQWRTFPDGSYWTSGWGSGMDNQTRVPGSEFHHRHHTWVDAMMQQALNCTLLLQMARVIDRDEFNAELADEYAHLRTYLNTQMWDEQAGFYFDRSPEGRLSPTKTIGAYWGLLCDVIPDDRAARMIAHLNDKAVFNRPHRVPTQAYDSETYDPYGGYWLGGVWSPTNYMLLCGLTHCRQHDLAFEIAINHVEHVASVFADTETLWENYAPEYAQPGKPAGRDFVGWTGLSAISIPIEYLVGLRPDPGSGTDLIWDIRLIERHGVLRYPIGTAHHIDLICERRSHPDQAPCLTIRPTCPVTLTLNHGAHVHRIALDTGEHHIQL